MSTDLENPTVLTPAMSVTKKVSALAAPSGNCDLSHLHEKQWKQGRPTVFGRYLLGPMAVRVFVLLTKPQKVGKEQA